MNKVCAFILPYLIVGFVGVMSSVEVAEKLVIEAFAIGILSGLWFLCLQKSEGTVLMKLGMILSIVLYAVAAVLGLMNTKLELLYQLVPVLAYLTAMEFIGLAIIYQNKPHLSMTYRYSYKNRRRRYF